MLETLCGGLIGEKFFLHITNQLGPIIFNLICLFLNLGVKKYNFQAYFSWIPFLIILKFILSEWYIITKKWALVIGWLWSRVWYYKLPFESAWGAVLTCMIKLMYSTFQLLGLGNTIGLVNFRGSHVYYTYLKVSDFTMDSIL